MHVFLEDAFQVAQGLQIADLLEDLLFLCPSQPVELCVSYFRQ
jgi:hypothetical protein